MKYVPRIISSHTDEERRKHNEFREKITAPQQLRREQVEKFCSGYSRMPKRLFNELFERATPGTLAHLVNGFGKFDVAGISYIDAVTRLLNNIGINPYVSQKKKSARDLTIAELSDYFAEQGLDPKKELRKYDLSKLRTKSMAADFHPWQIFAYCVMAGMSGDLVIPKANRSLRDIALNSRRIELNELGFAEMGHFLFGASFLVPDKEAKFYINKDRFSISRITALTLEAHKNTDKRNVALCMDFHLTEGLCAAVSKIPGLEHLRLEVQNLLEGQLDTVIYTAKYFDRVKYPENAGILDLILYKSILEPPLLLASHSLELAAFARFFGFDISTENKNAITYLANEASRVYATQLSSDSFDKLAHLRRALTLLLEIEKTEGEGKNLSSVDLSAYSIMRGAEDREAIGIMVDV